MINEKYSLIFEPAHIGIEYVENLKKELKSNIGWYNSFNAKAHITIMEFDTSESYLEKTLVPLFHEIAQCEKEIFVDLDSVASYENGAVYLKPCEETSKLLSDAMRRIVQPLRSRHKINITAVAGTPHLSIARRLNKDQVQLALNLFSNAKLNFDCKYFTLRKFNKQRRQFDKLPYSFMFLGLAPKPPIQQSLF